MIKCMVGLLPIDQGELFVLGNDLSKVSHSQLDEIRTEIGFLFQGSALYDSMTVRENLEFPLRRHRNKLGTDFDNETLIHEALDNVGLAHTVNMMPAELSGGMQRRVALARALILKPGAHQFCKIGAHSFLGMYAGTGLDVTAYTMIGGQPPSPKGINVEGLKRRGFSQEQIRNIKHAYRLVFRKGHKLAEAISQIEQLVTSQPELRIFLDSLRSSERGILR